MSVTQILSALYQFIEGLISGSIKTTVWGILGAVITIIVIPSLGLPTTVAAAVALLVGSMIVWLSAGNNFTWTGMWNYIVAGAAAITTVLTYTGTLFPAGTVQYQIFGIIILIWGAISKEIPLGPPVPSNVQKKAA